MMFLKRLNYRKLQNPAVAFPSIGRGADSAVAGVFRRSEAAPLDPPRPVRALQPSEFAKPALVMFLAYFVRCDRAPSTTGTRCCRRRWRSD